MTHLEWRDSGLALTILQPWACAIVHGPKRVENRTWAPPAYLVGQRIWLHAGKAFDVGGVETVLRIWKGYEAQRRVGPRSCRLHADCDVADELAPTFGTEHEGRFRGDRVALGALVGVARLAEVVRVDQLSLGGATSRGHGAAFPVPSQSWLTGPLGWMLDDVRALPEPIPCRGFQKLWTVPPEVLSRARADILRPPRPSWVRLPGAI